MKKKSSLESKPPKKQEAFELTVEKKITQTKLIYSIDKFVTLAFSNERCFNFCLSFKVVLASRIWYIHKNITESWSN